MKRKNIIILSSVALLLIAFTVWMIWGNVAVTVSEYIVESKDLPESFDGFRICQVSDLHNDELGSDNSRLLDRIKESAPDIIVITGDMVDSSRTDIVIASDFAQKAMEIAPVYYVSGNHEARIPDEYEALKVRLTDVGVTVLENEYVEIEKEGEIIRIVGIADPLFAGIETKDECDEYFEVQLGTLMGEGYNLVLTHRPNYFDTYVSAEADLVLAGHMHGGQFKIPFLGGLYSPSHGFFPDYDGGMYESSGCVMIVSRGVGNSRFPVRFNNPREIVIIELKK